MQLKPLERPSQDAAFPHLTLGCGSVDGSSDAPARGSRSYPCPWVAPESGWSPTWDLGANRKKVRIWAYEAESPSACQGPGHLHAETFQVRFPGGVVRIRFPLTLVCRWIGTLEAPRPQKLDDLLPPRRAGKTDLVDTQSKWRRLVTIRKRL